MAGNINGGVKAAKTNKKKYGKDFYKKIGSKGGQKSRGGGFASASSEMASIAGKIGGMKAANTRYGTPIDQDLIAKYQKELKILKGYQND